MMRLTGLAALVLAAALAWPAVAQQAPGPVPGPTPSAPGAGPGPGRMGRPGDAGQMLDMLAERIGVTDAEKAAVRKAVDAKREAANVLEQELRALAEVAQKEKATDEELSAALRRYDAALVAYRQKIKAIDVQLIPALSLRARVALTAIGVIDNGMGMRFGGRMRPGGRGMGERRGPGSGAPNPAAQGPQVIR